MEVIARHPDMVVPGSSQAWCNPRRFFLIVAANTIRIGLAGGIGHGTAFGAGLGVQG
jgi:hypothetical protein